MARRQRHDRIGLVQPAAAQVHRDPRAGDVGDDEVVDARAGERVRGHLLDRLRRVGQRLAARCRRPRARRTACARSSPRRSAAGGRAGRATAAGSSTNMNVMRLPNWPPSSARTLTGTIALRSRGRSSARWAWRRSAPATAASSTSLTVTPYAFLIARSSSSGRRAVARWRSGEPGSLSALDGATGSTAPASARAVRSPKAGSASGERASASGSRRSAELLACAVPGAAGHELERVGRRGGAPVGVVRRLRLGLDVEQQRAELDRRKAVDHAVVGLADEPDAPVAQPVGDPELPQRAVAAQRLRQHRVGELRQVLGGGAVDVLGGVEVLGVDPQRRVQPERVGGDALAEAGRAAEPARRCGRTAS